MQTTLQLSSPRRPRRARSSRLPPSPPLTHHASLAYAVPAPVLLAVATLSLAALRRIFSPTTTLTFRTLTQTLRNNLKLLSPRRSPAIVTPPKPLEQVTRLDELRDRSIAEIDALQPTPEDYASLAPLQRRALLQSAIERAYHMPRPASRVKEVPVENVVQESVVESVDTGVKRFWNAAEMLNGRAAALGFVLCLAREVAEPGHPSLFEQVVDVVVPIAQKTPPFLVAMVDRLVDLVT